MLKTGSIATVKFIQILILNFSIIAISIYTLYQDYLLVGRFQWVDKHAIEDQEELYTNVWCVALIIFATISILTQFIIPKYQLKGPLIVLIKFTNFMYGSLLLVLAFIFLATTLLMIIEFQKMEMHILLWTPLTLLCGIGMGYLGVQVISQIESDNDKDQIPTATKIID